jgi:hypothetical protein
MIAVSIEPPAECRIVSTRKRSPSDLTKGVHMRRRIWLALVLALMLAIPAGASAKSVFNESGKVSQLVMYWSGGDGMSAWYGDATAYLVDGEASIELFAQTVTQISDSPMCWEETVMSGYAGPGTMTVAKKNASAHATATLDGYFMSYVYCEPDYEAQDWNEGFIPVEVSIDFTATTPAIKLKDSESWNLPGVFNQHSRINGERRDGVAEITYNGITKDAEATLFSFNYSYHSNQKQASTGEEPALMDSGSTATNSAGASSNSAGTATTSAGTSSKSGFNESGKVSQLVTYWSGGDSMSSWNGDATAYMLNGETTVELWVQTITQISDSPMCWEEIIISGYAGPGTMTVAKKNASAHVTATLDGYFTSYVYCEPDYEAQDWNEGFIPVEVSIDFTATTPGVKLTKSESWNLPGVFNQHARISGERRDGVADVTYNGITREAEATIFSFKYSYHSNEK